MEKRELKFDRLPETLAQVGLRKTQWYAMVARGEAPQPVRVGGRAVAWERNEVQAWMRTRLETSRRHSHSK
ncbi:MULTISPECIES: AlpA family phage regulatory protein [unclassified Variovorax]|uniref:helix-turn-helix transcriptional regulator n=1 Tax=Variovorax sp. Sphag1AA TaxID=2587027 RepID=UPI0016188B2F